MPFHLILAAGALVALAAAAEAQTLREGRSAAAPAYATVPVARTPHAVDPYTAAGAGNGFTGAFSARQTARNLGY